MASFLVIILLIFLGEAFVFYCMYHLLVCCLLLYVGYHFSNGQSFYIAIIESDSDICNKKHTTTNGKLIVRLHGSDAVIIWDIIFSWSKNVRAKHL